MTYVARTSVDGTIRVYRTDNQHDPIDTIHLPPDTRPTDVLAASGWVPTGVTGPGGGWGAIYVQPAGS